ncbi:MAG: hypothetical protein ACJ8DI_11300 [Ktedonobacteraceae bacterium]
MVFSSRSRARIPIQVFALISVLILAGVFLRGTPANATGTSQQPVTKGILTPSTTIVPPDAPANVPRGVRRIHTGNAQTHRIPTSAGSQLAGNAGALLQNFNGTSSLDSEKTNFGAEFEPPDQGLCVGNGFVVEPVNSAYNIYRTNGTKIAGPFNVNRLFNDGFKQFTSDPRCFYDKTTNTWFAVILFISSNSKVGRIDLSVNPTGDPTTPWTTYRINTTDPGNPGCPCFGDQPLLGIDQDNIYVSTNEFSILGPQFNGAQIYAISKSELVGLARSVHFVHFGDLRIGGAIAASVQPAISFGQPDAEYFMDSLDPNFTFNNRIGVWAMTNRQAVSQGGAPTLSHVVITSEPYGVPPPAVQKGSSSTLDSGDDRMQQVQYINGNLWGELTTAVTIPNDNAERAGAAWFKVNPHLNGQVIDGAAILKQGYVTLKGNYLIYPAIQANSAGTAAVIMTLSGKNFFPSVVYTVLQAGQTTFGPLHVAAFGTGPYFHKSTRWGDYSWAILGPNGNSFWMATEYIPPRSSQTTDGKQNWGTRVIEVSA